MYQPTSTAEAKPPVKPRNQPDFQDPAANVKPAARVIRSGYLVEQLVRTPEKNLFNHVKFHLVDQQIKKTQIKAPRIMDIGCGLQVARRYLQTLNQDISYFGVDYESSFAPDAVVDLNVEGDLEKPMRWNPDIVMLLDVLEHLHHDTADLRKVVARIANTMPPQAHLIVTVPQWYRLDRFKLAHLHYPEHKIRLTQSEWHDILDEHFEIQTTQGVGYLSVLPYLPMALRSYAPDNALGRLFRHLRSTTFEKSWLKSVDLFLSNTLGKLRPFKYLSNDIMFVATPRALARSTSS